MLADWVSPICLICDLQELKLDLDFSEKGENNTLIRQFMVATENQYLIIRVNVQLENIKILKNIEQF